MSLSYADVGEILKMIDSSSCAEVVLELDGISGFDPGTSRMRSERSTN